MNFLFIPCTICKVCEQQFNTAFKFVFCQQSVFRWQKHEAFSVRDTDQIDPPCNVLHATIPSPLVLEVDCEKITSTKSSFLKNDSDSGLFFPGISRPLVSRNRTRKRSMHWFQWRSCKWHPLKLQVQVLEIVIFNEKKPLRQELIISRIEYLRFGFEHT